MKKIVIVGAVLVAVALAWVIATNFLLHAETRDVNWRGGEKVIVLQYLKPPTFLYRIIRSKPPILVLVHKDHTTFERPCRREENCVSTTFDPQAGTVVYVRYIWEFPDYKHLYFDTVPPDQWGR